jgi:phospholipid transport system substrate-binding protein
MNREPVPAPSAVARYLDQQIAPLFDFRSMARAAGGRLYETLSPQQRADMEEEIKRMFLTRLTIGLAGYDGQQVRFLRPHISPDGSEATISMAIMNPGRYPARIDFRLAFHGRDWRIIDLAANGTSAVVYYRNMLLREAMSRARQRSSAYPERSPR